MDNEDAILWAERAFVGLALVSIGVLAGIHLGMSTLDAYRPPFLSPDWTAPVFETMRETTWQVFAGGAVAAVGAVLLRFREVFPS